MSNNYFRFKQFTVQQDQCAMKVGTDGVLLGAWVKVEGTERILDAGTGTGLIALMIAQRSTALIDAVEIDKAASEQAAENCRASRWNARISVVQDSFQHFAQSTTHHYDLIVSNPPFFRNSIKPPEASRSLARHDDQLTYESLLFYSSKILKHTGRLAVIIPAGEINYFTVQARFHGLYPSQIIMIRPHQGKDYSRCLAAFSKNNAEASNVGELSIKKMDDPDYTGEYKALTREYYLKFE